MANNVSMEAATAAATWWLNSMIEPVDESSRNFYVDVLASRIQEDDFPELKCDGQPSGVLLDSAMESGIGIENYRDHSEMVLDEDGKIFARAGEQLPWEQVWPEADED